MELDVRIVKILNGIKVLFCRNYRDPAVDEGIPGHHVVQVSVQ